MRSFIIANLGLSILVAGCASRPAGEHSNNVLSASSYACEADQVPGTTAIGEGAFGCHFRLRNPETRQIRANVPYKLKLYTEPESSQQARKTVLSFEGVTDAQGRSVYVRAPFFITPDRLYFVEKIGSGPYMTTPRLVRATDGKVMPGMHYNFTWCGEPYAGVTDEQGNGVEFHSERTCKVNVKFYAHVK